MAGSLDLLQTFQMQGPTAKVRMVDAILAAGDVKAQWGSGFCMWSSLSSRIIAPNSLLSFVRSHWTARWMA